MVYWLRISDLYPDSRISSIFSDFKTYFVLFSMFFKYFVTFFFCNGSDFRTSIFHFQWILNPISDYWDIQVKDKNVADEHTYLHIYLLTHTILYIIVRYSKFWISDSYFVYVFRFWSSDLGSASILSDFLHIFRFWYLFCTFLHEFSIFFTRFGAKDPHSNFYFPIYSTFSASKLKKT